MIMAYSLLFYNNLTVFFPHGLSVITGNVDLHRAGLFVFLFKSSNQSLSWPYAEGHNQVALFDCCFIRTKLIEKSCVAD